MAVEKLFKCPRCSKLFISVMMRKVEHQAGIMLDVCDKCHGMWVDGNEIDVLYSRGGLKNPKKSPKAISKKRASKEA